MLEGEDDVESWRSAWLYLLVVVEHERSCVRPPSPVSLVFPPTDAPVPTETETRDPWLPRP